MRAAPIIVALAFAVASCTGGSVNGQSNQVEEQRPNDPDFDLATNSVLLDPASAEFRNVANGPEVCGEVNAKNSYGGYTGFKVFIFDRATKHLWIEDSPLWKSAPTSPIFISSLLSISFSVRKRQSTT
jgi:hypothetical protein